MIARHQDEKGKRALPVGSCKNEVMIAVDLLEALEPVVLAPAFHESELLEWVPHGGMA
jgi:hypothetical protein